MKPDVLFLGAGVAALLAALYLAFTTVRRSQKHGWAVLLWTTLAAGFLVQGFAPRLRIEHGSFDLSRSMISNSPAYHPEEIVGRERTMQAVSALLTMASALGLALHYRRHLMGERLPSS